jgi:uncharacterized membrane protein
VPQDGSATEEQAGSLPGDHPRSTATLAGHPLHPMLIPFPIVCFIGALISDILFASTRDSDWSGGSVWLLGAGLLTGVAAALAGFIDYRGDARIRRIGQARRHMVINSGVMLLEAINFVLRFGEGPPAVHSGLWLSLLSVALLAYSGWLGGELVYRHGVGVRDFPIDQVPREKLSRDRR